MNNIIGNKMFTYIDKRSHLNEFMVSQYNDSLIFIGDEKQIFVPKINTYIGIGTTAYNALKNDIQNTNANLIEYNKYIHRDTVNNIYVQFSPDEVKGKLVRGQQFNNNISDVTVQNYFKANKNIILKGLNDYLLVDGKDEVGNTITTVDTSGITVNIQHSGSLHTGTWQGNSYAYYDPYDIITIDDTKTWAYITASNSYMINFVEKFSSQQANRIYKDLMGISTVYIEKEFEEAFNYNINNGKIELFDDVYVKQTNGQYATVSVSDDGKSIKLNGDIIYSIDPSATVVNIANILSPIGGYEEISQGNSSTLYPIWYHLDDSSSNTYNMNIADGINTLKEVAYLLDIITDGNNDDGISLAYNIAQNHNDIAYLLDWKNKIGNESVSSFQSKSSNDLLTVDYYSLNQWNDRNTDNGSTGHVELDINLIMAQTYTLNGATYAAYLTNHNGANKDYYVLNSDPTSNSSYIQTNSSNYEEIKNAYQAIYNLNNLNGQKFLLLQKNSNGQYVTANSLINVSDLNANSVTGNNYIYWPYTKHTYNFTEGLTDVKWVTTYVGWLADDINKRINSTQTDSYSYIIDRINDLDVSGSKQAGKYVSYVTQTNGYIFAYQEKLPIDMFDSNLSVWGSYSYVHVDKQYWTNHTGDQYYQLSGSGFVPASGGYGADDYNPNFYTKVSSANMVALGTSVTLTTLITNAGNTSYYWRRYNGATGNHTYSYIPLDLQSAYTGGQAFNNNLTIKTANTYYYLAGGTDQVKYVDVSYTQRENGSTLSFVNVNITYLSSSSETNSGLADAYDVRRTIESMFKWVDLNTNKII